MEVIKKSQKLEATKEHLQKVKKEAEEKISKIVNEQATPTKPKKRRRRSKQAAVINKSNAHSFERTTKESTLATSNKQNAEKDPNANEVSPKIGNLTTKKPLPVRYDYNESKFRFQGNVLEVLGMQYNT